MSIQTKKWENRLLDWAHEAYDSHTEVDAVTADQKLLDTAYDYCERITRVHSKTFYLASMLLPKRKRRAAQALYAFCRLSDDLIDEGLGQIEPYLTIAKWREHVLTPSIPMDNPVAIAWAHTRVENQIPWRYAEQLIEGVSRDLNVHRYTTFTELTEYCYGVASTVGLMAMHIIGFSDPSAIPYAVKLGVALQLTNILRDVGEDWEAGRLYLPLNELAAYGLTEADIASGRIDDRWHEFMRFQIARNRQLYRESIPGIAKLVSDGRFAIAAAAELYQAILNDIEAHGYDVFSRRAYVGRTGKMRRLPAIWLRTQALGLRQTLS